MSVMKDATIKIYGHHGPRKLASVIFKCRRTENFETPYKFDCLTTWIRRSEWFLLVIKPTRCINFSNLFLKQNSTLFGQFLCPSSGVFHCTHSNGMYHTGLLTACEQDQDGTAVPSWSCRQQTCMAHIIAVCTVKNSRRWTEELSKTCRVLFQK